MKKSAIFLSLLLAIGSVSTTATARGLAAGVAKNTKSLVAADNGSQRQQLKANASSAAESKKIEGLNFSDSKSLLDIRAKDAVSSLKKGTDKKTSFSTMPNSPRVLVSEDFNRVPAYNGYVNALLSNGQLDPDFLTYPGNQMLYGYNCYYGYDEGTLEVMGEKSYSSSTAYVDLYHFDPRYPWYLCLPYLNYTNNGNYYYPAGIQFQILDAKTKSVLKTVGTIGMDAKSADAMEVGQLGLETTCTDAILRIKPVQSYYNTAVDVCLSSIDFYGVPAYTAKGIGTPTNVGYTVYDNLTGFDITSNPSTNATEMMVYVEREVTPKADLSSYNLITIGSEVFSSLIQDGDYNEPNPWFCMQDLEYGVMNDQTSHWLNVAGTVPAFGFEAFPYLQNHYGSYGGFETYYYDLSVPGSSLKFTAAVKGDANSQLKVTALALNKSTNKYESVKTTTVTVGNANKNINFTVSNSEVDANVYDLRYVQFGTQVISTGTSTRMYENVTNVYFTNWAIDVLNVPAGSTFRMPVDLGSGEIDNGSATCAVTGEPLTGDEVATYQYYFKVRDVSIDLVHGIHSIIETGEWCDLIPVVIKAAELEAPVFKYNGEVVEGSESIPYGAKLTVETPTGDATINYTTVWTGPNGVIEGPKTSESNSQDITILGSAKVTAKAVRGGDATDEISINVKVLMPAPQMAWAQNATTYFVQGEEGNELDESKLQNGSWKPYILSYKQADYTWMNSVITTNRPTVAGNLNKAYVGQTPVDVAVTTTTWRQAPADAQIAEGYGKFTYTLHSVGKYGDVGEDVTIILYRNNPTVHKDYIKFREDDEPEWLNGGFVPDPTEGERHPFLTIRYHGVDGNDADAAWNNYQEGKNTRFNPGCDPNATQQKKVFDQTPADVDQATLDAAPVHLNVQVELNNEDRTWNVINPKYEGWDWDEGHYENGVPDDFYVNQVQAYPTAPGYIRIPLIAQHNIVTVTAKANDKVGTHSDPEDPEDATITKTYSFAQRQVTGVDEVEIDADAPARYYNLQGIEVKNPGRGVYIKVQGNKSSKVSIL